MAGRVGGHMEIRILDGRRQLVDLRMLYKFRVRVSSGPSFIEDQWKCAGCECSGNDFHKSGSN